MTLKLALLVNCQHIFFQSTLTLSKYGNNCFVLLVLISIHQNIEKLFGFLARLSILAVLHLETSVAVEQTIEQDHCDIMISILSDGQ